MPGTSPGTTMPGLLAAGGVRRDRRIVRITRLAYAAFEGFVVHMHVAWLYLLHARFIRDNIDYRYRDQQKPRRFVKVDGEYKRWELARCVEQRWPDPNDPVRKNLEFFIGLRKPHRAPARAPGCESRPGRGRSCPSITAQL
jgi:Protein of unknown function (DUF3644)